MIGALYKILGVKADASDDELRSAYVARAKQTHPDAGGDVAAFQEVAHAYRVLGDPVKRLAYDTTGSDADTERSEDAAVMIVRNLVEQIVSGQQDPSRTDFAAWMRGELSEGARVLSAQARDIGAKMERCRKIARRFTSKDANNLVAKMIESRAADMERQLAGIEMQRAQIEAATALLQGYEYPVDATPVHSGQHHSYLAGQLAAQAQRGFSAFGGAF